MSNLFFESGWPGMIAMTTSLLFRMMDNNPLHDEEDYLCRVLPYDIFLAELNMLLTTRSCLVDIDNIESINASILNYGVNLSFCNTTEGGNRYSIPEQQILTALHRFEPRLSVLSINTTVLCSGCIRFTINARYADTPRVLKLEWYDSAGRLAFYE